MSTGGLSSSRGTQRIVLPLYLPTFRTKMHLPATGYGAASQVPAQRRLSESQRRRRRRTRLRAYLLHINAAALPTPTVAADHNSTTAHPNTSAAGATGAEYSSASETDTTIEVVSAPPHGPAPSTLGEPVISAPDSNHIATETVQTINDSAPTDWLRIDAEDSAISAFQFHNDVVYELF